MDSIAPGELARRLARGDAFQLLDVREPEELAICRIAGALHIPLGDVRERQDELDPDLPLVCICHHGVRSASAAGYLESQGFQQVFNLTGGVERWAVEVDSTLARY